MFKFLLSKRKAPLIEPDSVVGIGKHPAYVEFIQHGDKSHLLSHFAPLLKAAYNVEVVKHFANSTPPWTIWACILSEPNGELLAGQLGGSKDSAARIYPFTIMRQLNHPLSREFQSAIPLLHADYFEGAYKTFSDPTITSLSQLHACIDQLAFAHNELTRVSTLEIILQGLKRQAFSPLLAAIVGSRNETSQQRFALALAELINDLKKGLAQQQGFIRVPIVDDGGSSVVFWLQLFDALVGLFDFPVSIYWQQGSYDKAVPASKRSLALWLVCGLPSELQWRSVLMGQFAKQGSCLQRLLAKEDISAPTLSAVSLDEENLFNTLNNWSSAIPLAT